MIKRRALLALAVSGVFCFPVSADGRREAALKVFGPINERLSWMDDVALYKLKNAVVVEDLEREALVLHKALDDAGAAGLDSASVEAFFRSQIAAAKAIQHRCLAQWQMGEAPKGETVDLVDDVRPELIRIGAEFLENQRAYLLEFGPLTEALWPLFLESVSVPKLSVLEKRQLFVDLMQISLNN